MNRSDRSIVMTRYILGQSSEDERARLEEEYFANSDLFEEMVAAENDLIDAYVAGKLSGDDLLQFEKKFLNSPERQERVAFARSQLSTVQRQELSNPSPLQGIPTTWRSSSLFSASRVALAFIFLSLLAGSLWLGLRDIRLGRDLAQIQNSRAQLERKRQELEQENAELQAELAQRQPVSAQGSLPWGRSGEVTVVLRLSADLARGHGKPNILPLSFGIRSIVLMLETESGPYESYEISLETPEGDPLLQKKGLNSWATVQGRLVAVQLPAAALERGDYVLRLMGVNPSRQPQEVRAYSFRVVTR